MKKILLLLLFLSAFFIAPAFASIATPANISSIAVNGSTVTVTTATAHNVSSSDPGFCILNSSSTPDNVCGTATSITSSTVFVFSLSGATACASSCGTAQPAPVFMLKSSTPQFGQLSVTACMYVFVTAGVSISGGTSQCSGQFATALSGEINTAITNGLWVEYVATTPFSNSATLGTIEQYFQAMQFSYQLQQLAPGGFTGHECDVTGCN